MARIVVCGYMIRHPVAGNLLAYFHYVLGLSRLGHDVVYLEESGWPYSCYDPVTRDWKDFPHTGLRVVRALMDEYGVNTRVVFINRDTGQTDGAERAEVVRVVEASDLLLNVGGVCWLPEFALCRRRALIDLDPFFTQVDHFGAKLVKDYHVHFSYGVNIGRQNCTIPANGVHWISTVPPVVPELWNGAAPSSDAAFTSVANWSAYGGVNYQGEHYGQKDEEFLRVLDLPARTSQRLELAVSGADEAVRAKLQGAGWGVRDAGEEVSTTVDTYRGYLLGSRGEFSVAKHAYVKTHSGWFSDRSVCYLAAGLPVVLQDTGFTEWLPTGRGVLPFTTVEEAAECLAQVGMDYASHRRAAREIADQVFDYRIVLPQLLDIAFGTRSPDDSRLGVMP